MIVKSLSRVRLFATLWTAAHQAPPCMAFSRQEYWRGLPFPSPGHLPDPGYSYIQFDKCLWIVVCCLWNLTSHIWAGGSGNETILKVSVQLFRAQSFKQGIITEYLSCPRHCTWNLQWIKLNTFIDLLKLIIQRERHLAKYSHFSMYIYFSMYKQCYTWEKGSFRRTRDNISLTPELMESIFPDVTPEMRPVKWAGVNMKKGRS